MKLDDLEAFARVAERGSFTKAAKAMGMPKSTLSRRIQRLEEALGLTLIQRAGRTWALTEDGTLLASRSHGPLRELADVRHALADARDSPQGTLRVAIPIEFAGSASIAALLRDYRRAYPDVVVELQVDARLVDLVEEGVDLALRGHTGQLAPRAGLIARHLGAMEGGLVASPAYLDQRGRPKSPAELKGHDLIAPSLPLFGPAWPFSKSKGGGVALGFEPRPGFRSNEFRSLLAAAAAGCGVGGVPLFIAQDELEAGRVERVLPSYTFGMGSLSAVWPRSRNLSPRIRTFVDFLVDRLVPALTVLRSADHPGPI
jgi:DNA-binding transcriptional LysR family regulator